MPPQMNCNIFKVFIFWAEYVTEEYISLIKLIYFIQIPSINVLQADLGDWDKTREVISSIGAVDLLVNNAGVAKLAKFTEMKKEDLEW